MLLNIAQRPVKTCPYIALPDFQFSIPFCYMVGSVRVTRAGLTTQWSAIHTNSGKTCPYIMVLPFPIADCRLPIADCRLPIPLFLSLPKDSPVPELAEGFPCS